MPAVRHSRVRTEGSSTELIRGRDRRPDKSIRACKVEKCESRDHPAGLTLRDPPAAYHSCCCTPRPGRTRTPRSGSCPMPWQAASCLPAVPCLLPRGCPQPNPLAQLDQQFALPPRRHAIYLPLATVASSRCRCESVTSRSTGPSVRLTARCAPAPAVPSA